MNISSKFRARGPADPSRRNRLIEAALSIMLSSGVQAVTHRTVAARAEVPLGSTTYYFKTLDDFFFASIEKLTEETRAELAEWSDNIRSHSTIADDLTYQIIRMLTRDREKTIVAYELYFLALRRPAFRIHNKAWMDVFMKTLTRFFDGKTASALAAMADGLLISGLLTSDAPDFSRIKSCFLTILGNSSDS